MMKDQKDYQKALAVARQCFAGYPGPFPPHTVYLAHLHRDDGNYSKNKDERVAGLRCQL